MRNLPYQSALINGNLAMALAPALTPKGIVEKPLFFKGTAAYPQILSRGFVVLSEITATRYFKQVPTTMRDPILSSQGDILRAEVFSACNSVYARLDLLQNGFDGEIGFGTTNVDIGPKLRAALTNVKKDDNMKLEIGGDGLNVQTVKQTEGNIKDFGTTIIERPVTMPDRWIRALGNANQINKTFVPIFEISGIQATTFIAQLPAPTAKSTIGFLVQTPLGIKYSKSSEKGALPVSGIHRLSALKRIFTNITKIKFFAPADAVLQKEPTSFMVQVEFSGGRISLGLTAEAAHGFSGEGALLSALATADVVEDAYDISNILTFNSKVNINDIRKKHNIEQKRAEEAMVYLAVEGKLGWDLDSGAYFHRELPDDPNRVLKDNPRLVAAKKLIEDKNNIRKDGENTYIVHSKDTKYVVDYKGNADSKCTCRWYFDHKNGRGPCKHILAVSLIK
ncbi:MAG: SWIM zinc finger domain-containing protein [Defluviitaleaceae bacterium]|nr:SWIM zinc finger domain-containing protein [Defluviitaleaceae bacterium]